MLILRKKHLLNLLPDALVVTRGPARDGVLYLTFDDGPNPAHTPYLLDLLAANDARATFFVLGGCVEQAPDLARRIVAHGHALGNHSYDHPEFAELDTAAQVAQIEQCDQILAEFDGCERRRFRPPRGVISMSLLLHCLRQRRCIAYWTRDSLDYQERPAHELALDLDTPPPRGGDIVLMHDDGHRALDMLKILLPRWRARGYRFEALPPLPA